MSNSIRKRIVKHLLGNRLKTIRDLALHALEASIRDTPVEVHQALTAVIDAVLDCETAVIKWEVKKEEG